MFTAYLVLGLAIILVGVLLAYIAYETYKPVLHEAESLDKTLSYIAYELINLVVKLGFLGLMIWGGGILAKHGIHALLELRRIEGEEKRLPQQKSESQH